MSNNHLVPEGYEYEGSCNDGFEIYVQNQYTPAGVRFRRSLDFDTEPEPGGLKPNERLIATGWTNVGDAFNKNRPDYANNPEGLRAEVWFWVSDLGGWVPDAGVRKIPTERVPKDAPNDGDDFFIPSEHAAPQPPGCKLTPR